MEDIRTIVIEYQERLHLLQTLTKQTKEIREECKNLEESLISKLQSANVSKLFTDTATLRIVQKIKKPSATISKFTDVIFKIQTTLFDMPPHEADKYVDLLVETFEGQRKEGEKKYPTLQITKRS